MTREDLENAILDTEEEWIEDALPKTMGRQKRSAHGWLKPVIAAAACAVIALAAAILWPKDSSIILPNKAVHAYALAEAQYPTMANGEDYYVGSYDNWRKMSEKERNRVIAAEGKARKEDWALFEQTKGNGESLKPFLQQAITATLKESGSENRLSAPLNLYLALAMLSEATAGATRQEILDLIGADSQESLREQVQNVWLANYFDNGYVKSVLNNSLWLSNSYAYHQACVDTISDSCFASVFTGEMGSPEYDMALQNWINERTGGLLKESASKLEMDKDQILNLVSTLLFQDEWFASFAESLIETGVFHAVSGDIQAEFMREENKTGQYYFGNLFGAYGKEMKDSGAVMYFILPDEGVSMDRLLADEELQAFLTDETAVPSTKLKVHFALPKFDITEDRKLGEVLQSLGVHKVFDVEEADFSSLLPKEQDAFVSDVLQGARIIVNEKGAQAASYVTIPVYGAPPPAEDEIDFVLDRPFIFVLRSRDGLPLLAGVVNEP